MAKYAESGADSGAGVSKWLMFSADIEVLAEGYLHCHVEELAQREATRGVIDEPCCFAERWPSV